MWSHKKNVGITLIEILLFMVLASVIILISIGFVQQRGDELRLSKTTGQIQQLLNATLAFYMSNGKWPKNMAELQGGNFLPPGQLVNSWGKPFNLTIATTQPEQNKIYMYTLIGSQTNADPIAHKVPYGFITTQAGAQTYPPQKKACTDDCYVVASVDIPGFNLSNMSSINFVNLYRNGACVPVPTCPVGKFGTMRPKIFVVPVQVAGTFLPPGPSDCIRTAQGWDCRNLKIIPISSFSAFATGPALFTKRSRSVGPPPCSTDPSDANRKECFEDSSSSGATEVENGQYWRVCLSITTEMGEIKPDAITMSNSWGISTGAILAMVRCEPDYENSGSSFSVWSH